MKSVCIKTNNQKVINYLLKAIDDIQIDNIYYSSLEFKIYQNIIVHYKGNDFNRFISEISHILSNLIIDICEEDIFRKIISHEYFYFDSFERSKILDFIFDLQDIDDYSQKQKMLYNLFNSYLQTQNKIFLDGFITFRLKDYLEILANKVDCAVNRFLIDKEYAEFISILKMYISSQESTSEPIHLFYCKSKSILLDENKNIIEDKSLAFNAKYLSDITFSANDYALNTLLSIVPNKIYVHLVDNNIDEFIETLKLIFEDRIIFCQ